MIEFFIKVCASTTGLLLDSSIYILGGLLFSGLLSLCLSPEAISKHLGKGPFSSVFKAAFLGIPLPLCSCGVLPAAVSLKKQGANSGATTAFLISTPESGIDSIAVSYALLDPLLTIARPVAAFFTAIFAGVMENIFHYSKNKQALTLLPIEARAGGCCADCCSLDTGHQDKGLIQKVFSAMVYAFTDVWADLAGWFFAGLLIAGFITALVPDELIYRFLGGGPTSMLLMLLIGIPLYICATASTPVAAALIMKGVSPGAALVFLLAGPATNMTSLTVLAGILGKKTLMIYLATIAFFSVTFGLVIDQIYLIMNISPQTIIGKASDMLPLWLQIAGAVIIVLISVKPFCRIIRGWRNKNC
jgi:uncharacterized membrane protein YraQ (UPF0718 family)